MNWVKKLFRSGGQSAADYRPGVIDLRSSDERQIERDATRPLRRSDENAARTLCHLARDSQEMGDAKFNEMKRIGEQLYSQGGHALMQKVCYRVKALGGSHSYVSTAWNGVGEWMD